MLLAAGCRLLPPDPLAFAPCGILSPPSAKLPVMEITFLLHKTKVEPGSRIEFASVWGMPIKGERQAVAASACVYLWV